MASRGRPKGRPACGNPVCWRPIAGIPRDANSTSQSADADSSPIKGALGGTPTIAVRGTAADCGLRPATCVIHRIRGGLPTWEPLQLLCQTSVWHSNLVRRRRRRIWCCSRLHCRPRTGHKGRCVSGRSLCGSAGTGTATVWRRAVSFLRRRVRCGGTTGSCCSRRSRRICRGA